MHAPHVFRFKSYNYFHNYQKLTITNYQDNLYGVMNHYVIIDLYGARGNYFILRVRFKNVVY